MKNLLKSKINQRLYKATQNIFKTFALLFILLNPVVYFTNASYQDTETSTSNTFTAGCWAPPSVPELSYPANNYYSGLNSTWDNNPHMDWSDSTDYCDNGPLQYQYESYRDVGLTQLAYRSSWLNNSFIPAPGTPEGNYYWRVRARDQEGRESDFSSPWLLIVDRTAPSVQINFPGEGSQLNGTVNVMGTITDLNPHHYWLVIENSSGSKVAGPGVVNHSTSISNQTLMSWDTTTVADGQYTIKLEARDAAGNKQPNLSPVPTDPGVYGDSVHWIVVTVNNTLGSSTAGTTPSTIALNEIYPNPYGPGTDDNPMPEGEWVELYNLTGSDVNVSGWYLYDAVNNGIMITTSNTGSGSATVPASGYLVVYLNGAYTNGWLNNSGDSVSLYNGHISTGSLIDTHTYSGSVPDGKSIARIPDGTGPWYDPIPTPGSANKLIDDSNQTNLSLYWDGPSSVGFTLSGGGLSQFNNASYAITYKYQEVDQEISGSLLVDTNPLQLNEIKLQTCSGGGACLNHLGVSEVKIKVDLFGTITRTHTDQIN
ncbi:lamin tail domain-containing protein [Patescibacteria group bacterium]